jgi:hypothetical protein
MERTEERGNHNATGHDRSHQHSSNCGHQPVPHEGHSDYVVNGRVHHAHEGHCDDRGVTPTERGRS